MGVNITVYKGCRGDWYVSFNDRYSPTFRLSAACRTKKDAEFFARELNMFIDRIKNNKGEQKK